MRWRKTKPAENEPSKEKATNQSARRRDNSINLDKYDCYSILGVTHNANVDEIKRAYRTLAYQKGS